MLSGSLAVKSVALLGLSSVLLGFGFSHRARVHRSSNSQRSAEDLLQTADELAWNNRWADAQPLYAQAENGFMKSDQRSRALYAQVSQEPPNESESVRTKILRLRQDLQAEPARDPETRLRVLTVLGMFETNYDASQASTTWGEVRSLALSRGHFELASRAEGEQGIAAFLLGDTNTAKREVVAAWSLAKAERDYAATVRYASVFGAGLVDLGRYKEALSPLEQAIELTNKYPQIAYPTIAIYTKVDALSGLGRYSEALALANDSVDRLKGTTYAGHQAQIHIARASVYGRQGNWPAAIGDYQRAITVSEQIDNFRGVVTAGGELAQAYLRTGDLRSALGAINKAIEANAHIPDELYLVPRNLAVKAAILAKLGEPAEAEALYREGIALVNSMLQHAPTKNVQRNLVAEISDVYSGYFAFLSERRRYDDALQALEQVRGRMETTALEHNQSYTALSPSADEQAINKLDLALFTAEDPRVRSELTSKIYNTELHMGPSVLANEEATRSVHLRQLQKTLPPHTLLLEYVLAEPASHVFAITSDSVSAYVLPAKTRIDADAATYRRELREQKEDLDLAHKLFSEVLEPVKEYARKPDLVIVPDGALHLLPFAALRDEHGYVLQSHTVDVNPSSTVFSLLSTRPTSADSTTLPYIGVAAWTDKAKSRNFLLRAVDGPERSEMVALPESRKEVETIAAGLPQPNAILLGAEATEARFKELSPAGTDVIHLALHGYADLDFPDRSALVFAPDAAHSEDGLLQVREIRALRLKAKLVTLSACNTGVGPVGQTGVENIVNAFLEAGAKSVVSTLWELEDHATEHLMTHFYQGLASHNRKVDALRSAQLEMLSQGLPPYFWASFQIVGEPYGVV